MLVLLDSDATIYTKSGTIIFELGTSPISADGESQITMEEDEAHVLVQQSYPQESLRRSESDMVQSTPAIPETITEEPRVHETPSVKSRFMNPDSATVSLPRGKLSRVDTFGDIIHEEDSTPTGKKPTAIMSPSRKGIIPDRVQDIFRKINNVAPVADMKTPDDFARPEEKGDEEKESQNSAEAVRKQFSQSAMITSFGSAMDEVVASVVDEDEDEGVLSDESTTPKSRIKGHGVPEGFLHEEHKKEITPKIVYGKNKRKAPVPRNKNVAAKGGRKPKNRVEVINDSTEETTKDTPVKRRRLGRAQKNSSTESMEEEDSIKVLPQMKGADRTEEEDAIMETADEEDETAPQPPRTQRGRKTVQSLPSTAATVETDAVVTGRNTRGKRAVPTKNTGKATKEQEKEPGIKEVVPTKPLRGTRGRRRAEEAPDAPDPISTTASEEEPPEEAPNPKKVMRKRQRPDDTEGNDDQDTQSLPRESSAESMIQVGQLTRSKRVKTTPVEKTPAAKRGKKDATPTPPSSGKFLGDTQYTVQDTQSQAPELKTKAAAKKRAAPPTKKIPARRQKPSSQSQLSENDSIENEEDAKVSSVVTRTRNRYEGDSPKIVFSNSGLDGKKVRLYTCRKFVMCC
jgi:hypothetical protein